MTLPELENLVAIGKLKRDESSAQEIAALLKSGTARLVDAGNASIAMKSRIDLAYDAAHAISPAALHWRGDRSENRYVGFRTLPHTAGIPRLCCATR